MTHCVIALLLAAQAAPPQTVTPAGRSAAQAQGVQGVTGMVPLQVQGVAGATSDVELHDHTTPAQHLTIDGTGKIGINNFPVAIDVIDRMARLAGHVICDSGCSGGASDLALSSAADEALATRAAVTSALRLRDTTLAANAQLIGWRGDATLGAWVNIKNASIAVTGTFWQATQPVSGTFWQATQPVSGTFWQATQPISGTVTTSPPANASENLAQVAGTATDTNSGNKSAGTLRVVLATDQPALTNKLLVTPDSVALPANQSTNVAQVAGTATDTNSGNKSAGTIRVVIATDQPALTNKLLVTPDSVALPANQSVNAAQLAGTTTDTNSGNKSAGTLRVVLATDQPALTNKLLVTPDSVALPANQSMNMAQVAGTNTVTGGLVGTLGVGGTAGNNAAITQNPLVIGFEARSSTPTVATNGNQIRGSSDLAGNQFVVQPISWTCNLQALAASLTQCQAAPGAGFSLYVTNIIATTTTTTAGTFAIRYGTGSNCATTPIGVWPQPGGSAPSRVVTAPISTAAPMVLNLGPVGQKLAAANALCVIGTATNTIDISIMGYTAP